jgi:integrase
MDNEPFNASDTREWRRMQAWRLKQLGWKQRDIAGALGASEGAVSQWLAAAQAIRDSIEQAGITRGPPFRPRLNPTSQKLGEGRMSYPTARRLLHDYFVRLPGALREVEAEGGQVRKKCLYTPHSTRATTATLLLEPNKDIRKVQELPGHRHVTTTQIYDKRRRQTSESASHEVPI